MRQLADFIAAKFSLTPAPAATNCLPDELWHHVAQIDRDSGTSGNPRVAENLHVALRRQVPALDTFAAEVKARRSVLGELKPSYLPLNYIYGIYRYPVLGAQDLQALARATHLDFSAVPKRGILEVQQHITNHRAEDVTLARPRVQHVREFKNHWVMSKSQKAHFFAALAASSPALQILDLSDTAVAAFFRSAHIYENTSMSMLRAEGSRAGDMCRKSLSPKKFRDCFAALNSLRVLRLCGREMDSETYALFPFDVWNLDTVDISRGYFETLLHIPQAAKIGHLIADGSIGYMQARSRLSQWAAPTGLEVLSLRHTDMPAEDRAAWQERAERRGYQINFN